MEAPCNDPLSMDSAVARHCHDLGHSYDNMQPGLLHACEKAARKNWLEELNTLF